MMLVEFTNSGRRVSLPFMTQTKVKPVDLRTTASAKAESVAQVDSRHSARFVVLEKLLLLLKTNGIAYKLLDWSESSPPVVLIEDKYRRKLAIALIGQSVLAASRFKLFLSALGLHSIVFKSTWVRDVKGRRITAPVRIVTFTRKRDRAVFSSKTRLAASLPLNWIDQTATDLATPRLFRNILEDCTFPVDIVYTWVDGRDTEWRQRWLAAKGEGTIEAEGVGGTHEARWESFDELRYSLRSVEMYAPWVRHIFLVTDRQRPAWLRDQPGLTVVDHSDVFQPYAKRPCFNSHVIESQLHHIAGLAEHFLYMNDDVLLLKPTRTETFFHANGLAKFFPSTAKIELDDPAEGDNITSAAGKSLRRLLGVGQTHLPINKMRHTPHPLRRSVMTMLETELRSDFENLGKRQFRTAQDFAPVSQLHHYYAYLKGMSAPEPYRAIYWDLFYKLPLWQRIQIELRFGMSICLNNSEGSSALLRRNQKKALSILERLYPRPSRFEHIENQAPDRSPLAKFQVRR